MTKKILWRVLGVATLSFLSITIGVKTLHAEVTPTMELTNSVNNWTVTQGTQLTLQARVLPSYYRTISRVEIRQGTNILNSCINQNTCSFTLNSVGAGTNYYQAIGYDVDGRIYSSQIINLQGTNNNGYYNGYNGYNYGSTADFSLTANVIEVDPIANSGMYIDARVNNGIAARDLRLFRVDDWRVEATNNCNNQAYNCTLRFYPVFSASDAGKTYTYEAQTTDVNNNWKASNRITVRVRSNIGNNGNQLPGVYLDRGTIPETLNADRTVSIRANAWDNEGLSKLTIYAYPRTGYSGSNYYNNQYTNNWYSSNPHFEKMCGTILPNVNCVLDIPNFYGYEGATFDVWAETVDQAGQRTISQYYTLYVNGNSTYYPPVNNQNPSITLNASTIPSEVRADQAVNITADAWDNQGLSAIKIELVPKYWTYDYGYGYNSTDATYGRNKFLKSCYFTNATSATCNLSINNFRGYEGTEFTVYATAYDNNENVATSKQYMMKVTGSSQPAPSNTPPTVETSISGNISSIRENQSITVTGRATDLQGVWGIEVRAQPSWSSSVITKRCIMANRYVTTATCSLNIGPFQGHVGQNIRVWTIAWETQNGIAESSDAKTISILAVEKPNKAPTLSVSASPKNVTPNQNVTFTALASDENGIDHIDVYVNARIVKTCSGVNTCSYTGGPFGKYAGTSVSYAAKVWDKTGKTTWSGYQYVNVSRQVSKATTKVQVATTR